MDSTLKNLPKEGETDMKDQDIPLWGSISHYKGRCTVHYQAHDNSCDIRLEGYSMDVFKNCPSDLPIIRFDKARIEDIILWLRESYVAKEYAGPSNRFGRKVVPLDEYLGSLRMFNIPISYRDTELIEV